MISDSSAGTCFLTLVRSEQEARRADLLVQSLRAFGGKLADCPVWVYSTDPELKAGRFQDFTGVQFFQLTIEDQFKDYYFADKVEACARAEKMAVSAGVRSLVWINSAAMILQPPELFDLAPLFDAAFRPVHVQNIGLEARAPLDDYWRGIYAEVGLNDTVHTVESYLDARELRPYFNSHLFSINPGRGILGAWSQYFLKLVNDKDFQSASVRDAEHQIFLHQVVLSALVDESLDWDLVHLLPPEYSYPLHFHADIPLVKRPQKLNDLVCPVYEGAYRYPESLGGIQVDEPLKGWLLERLPG